MHVTAFVFFPHFCSWLLQQNQYNPQRERDEFRVPCEEANTRQEQLVGSSAAYMMYFLLDW